jgi:TonB-linked SusC/RagA family outer membrane protein
MMSFPFARFVPRVPYRRPVATLGAILLWCAAPLTQLSAQAAAESTQPTRRARVVGLVTDVATKQPLAGVNVFLVGTPITASTGPDGRFIIPSAPAGLYNIDVRRLGYGPQRINNVRLVADSLITVNITLSVTSTRLDQVTVSGSMDAQSVAKSTITVDKITSENIPVMPTGSAANLIAGKVAGVAITRPSGKPGSGVNIVLRTPISGITEGGAPPSPLFVVDGVFLNQAQSVTTQDIESMDVESIEVIKGAAAASLYGSRAAAGVISITTRRGKGLALGTTQFQARSETGTDQFQTNLPKNQHHAFRQDANGNWLNAQDQVVPRAQRALKPLGIMDAPFTSPTYDHPKLFFNPGSTTIQSLQVQGNAAATNYNLAYTRNRFGGVLDDNEGYRRQTLRVNLDSRLNEKLNVGVSVNHTRGQDDASSPSFNNFYRIDTDVNLRELDPFPKIGFPYVIVPDSVTLYTNPLYTQYIADNVIRRARTLLNANASYRPFSWLSMAGDANYDRGDFAQTSYTARGTPLVTSTGGLSPSIGSLTESNQVTDGYIITGTVSATKTLGDLTARLSQRGETRREYSPSLTTQGTDFGTEGLKAMSQARVRTTSNSITDYRVLGAITNLGLSFKERYIGDFLWRREGNSLFGAANRWNTFGRASAAWILSEESWFPLPAFNQFKLRYSYGVTGVSPSFSDQYEAMTNDGTGAIRRSNLGNVNITPTFTKEQEIGIDLAYKSRLSATVTYVRNDSRDVFVNVPAPAVSGYQLVRTNPAYIGGNVLEFTLQGAVLTNPNGLRWDILVTGDNQAQFTRQFGRTCFDDGLQYKCDGIPLSEMWGNQNVRDKSQLAAVHRNSQAQFDVNDEGWVVPVGVGNTWRDGVAKKLWGTSVNIDGTAYGWGLPIQRRDSTGQLWYDRIGDSQPLFRFGFQNNFRYNNFRLFIQTTGQLGGDVYANSNQTFYASGDHPDVDQFGKPDELKKPVAYYNAVSNNNNLYLAQFVESGTHLTIAELMLGYTADAKRWPFLNKVGVSRAQIDLIGRNMRTFTNYTGLNVMAGSPTVRFDDATYPMTRTLTGVVTLTF